MEIFALPKAQFDDFLSKKKITDENVEFLENVALISINNTEDDDTVPYFKKEHPNVLTIRFDDVEEDLKVRSLADGSDLMVYALKPEQADVIFKFIEDNKKKDVIFIHCTAGVSRSGAVALFTNDHIGGNYFDFKLHNNHIQPNAHVYKMLREAYHRAMFPPTEKITSL